MTNRTMFLLLALGCLLVTVVFAFVIFSTPRADRLLPSRALAALLLLGGAGTIYFLVSAFARTKYESWGSTAIWTTFSCPHCQAQLDYSLLPTFQDEFSCRHCGGRVSRRTSGLFINLPGSPRSAARPGGTV
jgi:hypothetical protein